MGFCGPTKIMKPRLLQPGKVSKNDIGCRNLPQKGYKRKAVTFVESQTKCQTLQFGTFQKILCFFYSSLFFLFFIFCSLFFLFFILFSRDKTRRMSQPAVGQLKAFAHSFARVAFQMSKLSIPKCLTDF